MSGPRAASPGVCAVTPPPQPGHLIGETRVRDTVMGTTCKQWLSAACCVPKTQWLEHRTLQPQSRWTWSAVQPPPGALAGDTGVKKSLSGKGKSSATPKETQHPRHCLPMDSPPQL